MRRTGLNLIMCLVSVVFSAAVVLSVAVFCEPTAQNVEKNTVQYLENGQMSFEKAEVNVGEEKEESSLNFDFTFEQERLVAMLNMNYCYGSCFEDKNEMSVRAAIMLMDYSVEVEGYGFGVNASLVAGFMSSFYGVEVDPAEIAGFRGYVMIPEYECGSIIHTPVSVSEKDGVITVVTCAEIYDGGESVETFLAKSRFVRNPISEFGFSLKFSELL